MYNYQDSKLPILKHAGTKGMKWGYNDGVRNGKRTAQGTENAIDTLSKLFGMDSAQLKSLYESGLSKGFNSPEFLDLAKKLSGGVLNTQIAMTHLLYRAAQREQEKKTNPALQDSKEKGLVGVLSDFAGASADDIKKLQEIGAANGYDSKEYMDKANELSKGDDKMRSTMTYLLKNGDKTFKDSFNQKEEKDDDTEDTEEKETKSSKSSKGSSKSSSSKKKKSEDEDEEKTSKKKGSGSGDEEKDKDEEDDESRMETTNQPKDEKWNNKDSPSTSSRAGSSSSDDKQTTDGDSKLLRNQPEQETSPTLTQTPIGQNGNQTNDIETQKKNMATMLKNNPEILDELKTIATEKGTDSKEYQDLLEEIITGKPSLARQNKYISQYLQGFTEAQIKQVEDALNKVQNLSLEELKKKKG